MHLINDARCNDARYPAHQHVESIGQGQCTISADHCRTEAPMHLIGEPAEIETVKCKARLAPVLVSKGLLTPIFFLKP